MIIKYSEFVNENLNKARRVLRETNTLETNKNFIALRELLANNAGYLGKFTEWHFVNKIPLDKLRNLYNTISGVRLSNPIDSFKTPEDILNLIHHQRTLAAVNQIVNAIPSRTREALSRSETRTTCDKCYGNDEMDCTECDSRGSVDCKACEGGSNLECKQCNGYGSQNGSECKECNGDGEINCKICDGHGAVRCNKCKGGGTLECDKCKGEGVITKKGNELWNEFLEFLSLHVEKKDRIISFLARKGGRYENLANLKKDISEVVNSIQIEDIQRVCKNKSDQNIEFIYEDEKILMVAVNFEGVKKYGSSYWCITQERDSFDGYANDGDSIQYIIYFKDKEPFVDEESVMGVTMCIRNKDVEAAHWENDEEVEDEVTDKLFGKNQPGRPKKNAKPEEKKNILKGVDIDKIAKRLYRISELNSPKYFEKGYYLDDIKVMNDISQFDEILAKLFKYMKDEEFDDGYEIIDDVKNIIVKYSKKIGKLSLPDLKTAFFVGLDNCVFLDSWLKLDFSDIDGAMSTCEDVFGNCPDSTEIYKCFHKNGYVFDTPSNMEEMEYDTQLQLLKVGILSMEKNWDRLNITDNDRTEMEWILKHKVPAKVEIPSRLIDQLISYLLNSRQIDKYKKFVLKFLYTNKRKELNDKILNQSNDDDIAEICLSNLIPDRYKVRFSLNRNTNTQDKPLLK